MTSILRIDPLEKSSNIVANDTSTFVIPRGVFDLSTLKLWFLATIDGANENQMSLPRDVETMIDNLQVSIDGRMVQEIQNYNQLFRILEDYNKNMSEHAHRGLLSNSFHLHSGLGNTIYNVSNTQYCMTKWIGLLGSGDLIDTNKIGRIEIKINWAQNNVMIAEGINVAYKLDNLYFTLQRLDNSVQAPSQIEFDDYKTLLQSNLTYTQSTQMDVKSRKLDYVMSTFLFPNFKTMDIIRYTASVGTSYYFIHGSYTNNKPFPKLDWNFSINGRNLISYNPPAEQYLEYMHDIFPGGTNFCSFVNRSGASLAITAQTAMQYYWATGVRTDMDASEGINLAFNTYGISSDANNPNFSLLVAKTSSLLTVDQSGGYTLEK